MPGTQGEGYLVVSVGEDFFQFFQARSRDHEGKFQARCRNHEGKLPSRSFLGVVGTPGKSEAVHGDGRDPVLLHLKFNARMDGTALILGNGKDGAGNQLFHSRLRDADAPSISHIGKVGVFVGGFGGDGKGGIARPDGYFIVVIHHHCDRAFRQTADNVAKQSCRQDALAHIGNLGLDEVGDGGFHIVAGKAQAVSGFAEDALNGGDGAFLGDGSAGDVQAGKESVFFTGKAHGTTSFL